MHHVQGLSSKRLSPCVANHDLHDWGVSSRQLAEEFQLPGRLAKIRRWGDGILLEPIKPSKWPKGYFEKVKIKDSAFERQPQGDLPPAHQY